MQVQTNGRAARSVERCGNERRDLRGDGNANGVGEDDLVGSRSDGESGVLDDEPRVDRSFEGTAKADTERHRDALASRLRSGDKLACDRGCLVQRDVLVLPAERVRQRIGDVDLVGVRGNRIV